MNQFFEGQHCETTTTGNLLYKLGYKISEPMLFGLGEGLGFIFLNLSSLNLPFVGGRTKPFELTKKVCANLKLKLNEHETTSKSKAWDNLIEPLENEQFVGLQLDSYHLEYFSSKIHFAGHFIACVGFDAENIMVIDTIQQGGQHKVNKINLERARFEKGPMSAKARSWTIENLNKKLNFELIIKNAIKQNAKAYLNPQFKGMSYLGILKLSRSLPSWLELARDPHSDLILSSLLMEKAGTGGSIFRNFYRDFLFESFQILKDNSIKNSYLQFKEIAEDWHTVALLIEKAGQSQTNDPLNKASQICAKLAEKEKIAMEYLINI